MKKNIEKITEMSMIATNFRDTNDSKISTISSFFHSLPLELFKMENEKDLKEKMIEGIFDTNDANRDDVQKLVDSIYHQAKIQTEKDTYQAMEAFVHNMCTMHCRAGAQVPFSSVNFGMDTSEEGRMVSRNLLLAQEAGLGNGETPIFPILIFQVKEGVNYNPGDKNYDLFKLSLRVSAKRLFPNYVFVDAPFNLQYYDPKDPETIIATMGCRTRVIGNVNGKNTPVGRGNLSFSTINLPRLGIKHGINYRQIPSISPAIPQSFLPFDKEAFFKDFDHQIDLCIQQLLERYEIQKHRYGKNFPFLMGQHLWRGSDSLLSNEEIGDIINNGTLSVGFIGLAECLIALTGHHHGEVSHCYKFSGYTSVEDFCKTTGFTYKNDKETADGYKFSVCQNEQDVNLLGYAIIYWLRHRMEEASGQFHLNFSVLATPAEGLSGRFTKMDRQEYGTIPNVTSRDYYTNSFHVPVYHPIRFDNKIKIEAPFHALCNAGHISYVEVDGDLCENLEAFEAIVRCMKEEGIGYGSVNHPVDRDPVCGYTGVIEGNICPGCGRDISKHTTQEVIIPVL